ncbi:OLC1v1020838C1 [Oldenlandia corymbosa var. corymbosa]|uniref:OLC1v1020838C1 n=1 Tax=Oldenlandia corymbosa var. corymbosa TaxID=529605 RepID=A0AAV1BUC1_OLDCO|nr:OLC1v1020838C1 [Oldenlandia corymbosa var. corymbosa]
MKKLYRKGTVHPSPPPLVSSSDNTLALAFLPPTILTLAVALSPQDREVLAYLISCASSSSSSFAGTPNGSAKRRSNTSSGNNSYGNSSPSASAAASQSARRSTKTDQHPASFNCYCFGCYMSYWIRWDSSPNRQLIHEIIDAFEQEGSSSSAVQKGKTKKEKRKKNNKGSPVKSNGHETGQQAVMKKNISSELLPLPATGGGSTPAMEEEVNEVENSGESSDDGSSMEGGEGTSVRRFMGFLGEKIWGMWN